MHIYSVTPESVSPFEEFDDTFLTRLTRTAAGCERAGWSGMLVPHNLHEVDPWVVAAYLGSITDRLLPLIAVQPASLPPHTAASMASAYATLYGRPLHFNLVAGARQDELRRTGDLLDHDQRYERLGVYGRVLRALLNGEEVTQEGPHYHYEKFRLEPRPEVLSRCLLFVAGSSPASISVARDIADVVVTHPAPYEQWKRDFLEPLLTDGYTGSFGIRVGLIARPDPQDAWRIALDRFPETWQGRQETLLKTMSHNVWARELATRAVAEEAAPDDASVPDPYWLGAFRNGRASAPFLVGSHEDVGDRLGPYLGAGVEHILLNGSHPTDHEDINRALEVARRHAAPATGRPTDREGDT